MLRRKEIAGWDSMITVKSIYDRKEARYARGFLIERSWPRGRKGARPRFEGWLKDIAPSAGLSAWFEQNHDKWREFCRRYFTELDTRPEAWRLLLEEASHSTVELLHSSHYGTHNNAAALKEYLDAKLGQMAPLPGSDSKPFINLT
jgi:uncharacterized protein YeaO (DUF488 family)